MRRVATLVSFLAVAAIALSQGGATTQATTEKKDEPQKAKLWICENTDDDWNPIKPAKYIEKEKVYEWPAGKKFDVLIKNNGKPFGVTFLGIIIHEQGADGKDTGFFDEWMTDTLDDKKTTMWATVGGLGKSDTLKPGRYSIYIIDWTKRQVNFHPGDFKDYFAKITVVIK